MRVGVLQLRPSAIAGQLVFPAGALLGLFAITQQWLWIDRNLY